MDEVFYDEIVVLVSELKGNLNLITKHVTEGKFKSSPVSDKT
jgi:hypothetical protein